MTLGCRSGKHRSVLVAATVARTLEDAGWTVEVRHLGAYRTLPCTCREGPLRDTCAAVLHCGANLDEARASYARHLQLRARAFRRTHEILSECLHGRGIAL